MKTLTFVCCLLLTNVFGGIPVLAQQASGNYYVVGITPSQLIFREIALNVEKINPRKTTGLILSVRLSSQDDGRLLSLFSLGNEKSSTYLSERYKGITLGLNRKYFLKKINREYLEVQAFYRLWWFSDRFYAYRYDGGSTPDREFITSSRDHVVGLKLLWGERFFSKGHRKIGTFYDLYLGLGGRLQFINEYGVARDAWDGIPNGQPYTPYLNKKTQLLPSIQIGLNVGLVLRTQEKSAFDRQDQEAATFEK